MHMQYYYRETDFYLFIIEKYMYVYIYIYLYVYSKTGTAIALNVKRAFKEKINLQEWSDKMNQGIEKIK
jgi:hypothetical protein